jgi:DNA-binding NarL/FixJ family response regulator
MPDLRGVKVLIIEDNYLVATSVAHALEHAGASMVAVIGNLEDAKACVSRHHAAIDVALLDVNLAGVMSYPVADLLMKYDIPFIFATGYDSASLDIGYRQCPVCMKPFSFDSLVSAILNATSSGKVCGRQTDHAMRKAR